jgi:hypothetical protein
MKRPTHDLAFAEWVVQAPAGSSLPLTAWHDRAGRVLAVARLA